MVLDLVKKLNLSYKENIEEFLVSFEMLKHRVNHFKFINREFLIL